MTEYASRGSQNHNPFSYNQHLAMAHYSNGNGLSYLYGNGQIQYQAVSTPCSTYAPSYPPTQGTSATSLYMPTSSGHPYPYSFASTRMTPTLPSQSRAYPMNSHYSTAPTQRISSHHRLTSPREYSPLDGTECQDSPNQDTMLSEPVLPPLDGYPDVHEFDELMKCYVQGLSPKKQDKALIHARRAANIKHVLIDKKTTSIESAQFRFWVKKMFSLEPKDGKIPDHLKKICHEGKPVAVREKLFKILTKAHKQCQHGGRDKTSAQVRKVYSWVPKELISRFVKLCPTCQVRRGTSRNEPPESVKDTDAGADEQSPESYSVATSRKNSLVNGHGATVGTLPLQTAGFKTTSTFQQQNRWMTPVQLKTESAQPSPTNTQTSISRQDSYNTMPPMPMNCGTNGSGTGILFPPLNAYGHSHGASSAYTNSLSQASQGHVPTGSAYDLKVEAHYL